MFLASLGRGVRLVESGYEAFSVLQEGLFLLRILLDALGRCRRRGSCEKYRLDHHQSHQSHVH